MQLRDCELSRRHVVEKREQGLQGIVVRVRIRAEEEDLGIELVERALEIVGARHLDDALDAELVCLVPDVGIRRDDDGVGRTVTTPSTWPTRRRGRCDASRTPAAPDLTTRASAPCFSARPASCPSETSTRIEIPSPSAIA